VPTRGTSYWGHPPRVERGNRELGWPGCLFLSMWSGGLDLCGPPEDPRATRGGDTLPVAERAAVADGSRCREVQRELRGSKPESRGTEIEKHTTWIVAPRTNGEDYWKLFVGASVLHSPVFDHGHHAGKWISTDRVHWYSSAFKVPWLFFFFELHHQIWGCQDGGWEVWEAPGTGCCR
jgi:hypothetical protein